MTAAFNSLVWLGGGIATIVGAFILIWKAVKPLMQMSKDIEQLSDKFDKHIEKDAEKDKEVREGIGVICRCLLPLLLHALDDNSKGEIRKVLNELQGYLTKF